MTTLPPNNDKDGHTSDRNADKNDTKLPSASGALPLTAAGGMQRCQTFGDFFQPATRPLDGKPGEVHCLICDRLGRKRGQAGYNPKDPGVHWYPPERGLTQYEEQLRQARRAADELFETRRLPQARASYIQRIESLFRHGRKASDDDQAGDLVAA